MSSVEEKSTRQDVWTFWRNLFYARHCSRHFITTYLKLILKSTHLSLPSEDWGFSMALGKWVQRGGPGGSDSELNIFSYFADLSSHHVPGLMTAFFSVTLPFPSHGSTPTLFPADHGSLAHQVMPIYPQFQCHLQDPFLLENLLLAIHTHKNLPPNKGKLDS